MDETTEETQQVNVRLPRALILVAKRIAAQEGLSYGALHQQALEALIQSKEAAVWERVAEEQSRLEEEILLMRAVFDDIVEKSEADV
jgi:hypothetical protein